MSQMPQQAALPKCPSCTEPFEPSDRFCGACGYDLSAVPAPPQDHPTLAMNGPGPSAAADDASRPGAPAVTDAGAPGAADSAAAGPAPENRLEQPPEPEEYPLQAPDPRVAAESAALAEGTKMCVACRTGRVDGDGYCEN